MLINNARKRAVNASPTACRSLTELTLLLEVNSFPPKTCMINCFYIGLLPD